MIKPLLKNLVLVIAVIAGSVGASFLKYQNANSDAAHTEAKGDPGGKKAKGGHDKKDGHGKDSGKKDKGDHGEASPYGDVKYLKFKRQFIIPVSKNGKIYELVIMNLNIELGSKAPESSFSLEPKLRDSFIKDLLALSNQGVFSGDITSPETYELLRSTLMTSSKRIISEGVENVLILDIAKQKT